MSETEPTAEEEPEAVAADAPASAAVTPPAAARQPEPAAANSWPLQVRGPWWQYLVVGLVGMVLGGLICGGIIVAINLGHSRIDDRGRFQRYDRPPGFGPGFGPGGRLRPPGVRPRPLGNGGPGNGGVIPPSAPPAPVPGSTA